MVGKQLRRRKIKCPALRQAKESTMPRATIPDIAVSPPASNSVSCVVSDGARDAHLHTIIRRQNLYST